MKVTRRERYRTAAGAQTHDGDRSGPHCHRPITELSGFVRTPREDRTVGLQRHASIHAGTNRGHTAARAKTDNSNRTQPTVGGPIAELAIEVVAPGKDGAIGFQYQRVFFTHTDPDNTAARAETDNSDRTQPGGRRSITQLPECVGTPNENRTIGLDHHAPKRARADGSDTASGAEACHSHRSRLVARRSIAELTERVVTPRNDRAVRLQCQRVVTIGADRGDAAAGAQTCDRRRR